MRSKLKSVEAYAVIFSFAFNFNQGKAKLSMLTRQGALYFEARKNNFSLYGRILKAPYTVLGKIEVNSETFSRKMIASYEHVPLTVKRQERTQVEYLNPNAIKQC